MQQIISILFAVCMCVTAVYAGKNKLCKNDANIQLVARVVFGEARGEPANGQLAVAWTVVNRVHHAGYPNTVKGVLDAKYVVGEGNKYHEYNTLDNDDHTKAWNAAKASKNEEYRNAVAAATSALCKNKADPTKCAVRFSTKKCCLKSNRYWTVYCKVKPCPQKIGNHYFVCMKPAKP